MRVELLVGGKNGRFPGSNCLLVKGAKGRVLVDAGCRLNQILEVKGSLDAVVYTHMHSDHVALHEYLKGLPSYAPAYDASYSSLEDFAKRYAPLRWREWIEYIRRVFNLTGFPSPSRVYDEWEPIRVSDVVIEPVPAHGHTKGHHVLVIGGHIHLSDIDLTSFGPWYGHPESSVDGFISDMLMVIELEGEAYSTSHKETLYTRESVKEALSAFALALCRHFESTLRELERNAPATPRGLVGRGVIYKRYVEGAEAVMEYFEYEMISKILDYLSSRGVVGRSGRGYYLKSGLEGGVCGVTGLSRLTGYSSI